MDRFSTIRVLAFFLLLYEEQKKNRSLYDIGQMFSAIAA